MEKSARETPAQLIIDMVEDYFQDAEPLPATPLARRIIGPTNGLYLKTPLYPLLPVAAISDLAAELAAR